MIIVWKILWSSKMIASAAKPVACSEPPEPAQVVLQRQRRITFKLLCHDFLMRGWFCKWRCIFFEVAWLKRFCSPKTMTHKGESPWTDTTDTAAIVRDGLIVGAIAPFVAILPDGGNRSIILPLQRSRKLWRSFWWCLPIKSRRAHGRYD